MGSSTGADDATLHTSPIDRPAQFTEAKRFVHNPEFLRRYDQAMTNAPRRPYVMAWRLWDKRAVIADALASAGGATLRGRRFRRRNAPGAALLVSPSKTTEITTSSSSPKTGRITLVGAGPGRADLLPSRGARALADADVVLYDRLVDPELLSLAPPASLRIPVGNGKGFGSSQTAIDELLLEHAKSGAHVVRLKGGDAFIFGRGAEETDLAVLAGIDVEVVPGLSSSLAAPALAGIALTDRRSASGFAVISGHRAEETSYNWESFASDDLTVVVLMAATTADEVARQLLVGGRKAETAVAFVHRDGCPEEMVELTSLVEVSLLGCRFDSPTVMIVGEVTARSHRVWRTRKPLEAKRA